MTSKDIRLLQEVYDDMRMGEEREVPVNKDDSKKYEQMKIELGRGWNPRPNQVDALQKLTANDVNALVDHLNGLGDEEKNAFKDNLIKQVFSILQTPNV